MKNVIFGFLKVVLLLSACVASAFIVSFPLWIFSTRAPRVYTVLCLCVIFALAAAAVFRAARRHSLLTVLRSALCMLFALASIFASVRLVFSGHRLFALLLVLLTVAVEGVLLRFLRRRGG